MFARIGTWQGSPADLERWIVRGREQVKPAIRQDPGLTAVYWLVDREAGKEAEADAASDDARRILNKAEAEEHKRERRV